MRNIDRSEMISGFSGTFAPSFEHIMNKFFVALFISLIGTIVGFFILPNAPELFYIALVVEFAMIIASLFVRRSGRVGYAFVYTYVFISGITLFPAIGYYVHTIGMPLVFSTIAIVTLGFGVLAFIGYTTKKDLSFLSSILMIGLITLIGFSLVGLFVPSINIGFSGLLIASAGVIIFSGFTILDMNLYARYMRTEEDVPWFVLSIYLDYINLLLYALRLVAILTGNKRN